jgi:Fic family protein
MAGAVAQEPIAPQPVGRREERFWPLDPAANVPRNQRAGLYEVFIPAPIAERGFAFDGADVTALVDAQDALRKLNATPPRIATLGALARNLLRSESAASSRIEGVRISQRRLARAAYEEDKGRRDPRAAEVLGNVKAMERAIELGARAEAFAVADIADIHRTLLRFTDDAAIAGLLRDKQNWIGGNDYNPIGAAYVPPPHEHVEELLDDLCAFIARDDLAPLAQAAIVHAQFENIHPFIDGNGRVGRALIYSVLARRGDIAHYIPPISLVLAAEPRTYIGGLGSYSQGHVSRWCGRFAQAATRAAHLAQHLSNAIETQQEQWLDRLGHPRSDSAVRQLVSALPAQPVIDVPVGQKLTGKSHVAVGSALKQLEGAGIIAPLNVKRWGRAWECGELLDLVGKFERAVSIP